MIRGREGREHWQNAIIIQMRISGHIFQIAYIELEVVIAFLKVLANNLPLPPLYPFWI